MGVRKDKGGLVEKCGFGCGGFLGIILATGLGCI